MDGERQDFSIRLRAKKRREAACLDTNRNQSVRVHIIMLSLSMCSFVIRESFSIVADLPAWSLLAILTDHCHVTGLFPGMVSLFVIGENSGVLADLSAWLFLATLSDYCYVTDFLLSVISSFVILEDSGILANLSA